MRATKGRPYDSSSIVGDGALDVPFRGTARFEFITMLCRRAVWRILRRYPEDVIG